VEFLNIQPIGLVFLAMAQAHFSMKIPRVLTNQDFIFGFQIRPTQTASSDYPYGSISLPRLKQSVSADVESAIRAHNRQRRFLYRISGKFWPNFARMMVLAGLGGVSSPLPNSPNLEFMQCMTIRFRGHAGETKSQRVHPGVWRLFCDILHLVRAFVRECPNPFLERSNYFGFATDADLKVT
jgi:hypothetical protein